MNVKTRYELELKQMVENDIRRRLIETRYSELPR